MQRKILPALLLAFAATLTFAQNPIISGQFTADPTVRLFDGRLYLYPSHDIHPSVNPIQQQDWFCMADYHCFSTNDLTHWSDHGCILDQKDVPWGNPSAYSMWAPDCVQGKDGRYYLFFPDAVQGEQRGFGIGVAIGEHPYGPFVAEPRPLEGVAGIDPCVLQTSTGENYLFWGGGVLRVAKLNPNLLSLADEELEHPQASVHGFKLYGQEVQGLPEGFKEGPFAFERNGKFYLTFPWVRGKKKKATDNPTETLAYAMSDSPTGPYTFKGVIMAESPTGCWTNHHSIVEYEGQWYLFYHHNDYSPQFDKNRSVCCDSLFFNEDGTIRPIGPTRRGVGITDAREPIQMDRGNELGGGANIAYIDRTDCFKGWKTILPTGGWISYGNVNVPDEEYKVWINTIGPFGQNHIQTIDQTQLHIDLIPQSNGLYTIRLTNNGDKTIDVDWISLSKRRPLSPYQKGGMETGVYRNLFVEAGYSEEEVERKLQEVFNDVFFGPNKCYFEVGNDMGYICDIKNNDVRTEGMSYGMMISVQFNRKDIFDRLWRWSKKYMQISEGPMKGYFRWSCQTNGRANAQGPASDGELYFITSLLFASNLWGNTGEINYQQEAQYILDCIQPRRIKAEIYRTPDGSRLETPIKEERTISLIDSATQLITFVPGIPFTDPSYHLPAFYEVWAKYAEDGRASYWKECAQKSREYLHKSVHPQTGLNPDYNNFDGSLLYQPDPLQPEQKEPLIGNAFRYDSWRVPMNIALDYSWSCKDMAWQQNYAHTIQNFLFEKGIYSFKDQFNMDGSTPKQLLRAGNYPEKLRHSMGFIATSAAVSICCKHTISFEFIDQFWNSPHQPDKDGYFDAYYDGLLRLFAFMHLSGHYRVIERTPQLHSYMETASAELKQPDEEGFLRRWLVRDPLKQSYTSNIIFTDSFLQNNFSTALQPSKKDKANWHAFDSHLFNLKLYRYSTCTKQPRYGIVYWVTTIIESKEDISNVRLSIGSNSASKWWVDEQEVAILSGDRRMVRDDVVSNRFTLHKGENRITGVIVNGPGMSDFCVRLLDAQLHPITNVNLSIPILK